MLDLEIVIEDRDVDCNGIILGISYVYVNGERLDGDNHIKSILEYLGHNVTVDYI